MKTSESIAEVSKALTTAWGNIKNPKHNQKVEVKTKNGYTYTFNYTDLGGLIDEVRPHLKENGITIIQEPYTEVGESGRLICIETMLLHSSGEWMKSNPLKMPALNSIQDVGGQITYLKRYSLSAMLGVSSEEDNDSNLASGNEFNYSNTENKKPKQQDIGRPTLLAKFKQGGGTVDQFDKWYANQSAQGFDNNQMDAYLTKALVKKGKQ